MDEGKKLDVLYQLLERAEHEQDISGIAALKWAILELERMMKSNGTAETLL